VDTVNSDTRGLSGRFQRGDNGDQGGATGFSKRKRLVPDVGLKNRAFARPADKKKNVTVLRNGKSQNTVGRRRPPSFTTWKPHCGGGVCVLGVGSEGNEQGLQLNGINPRLENGGKP